jgi:acetyltransferase-like isoleucine patch superfamily enzyme
MGRVVSALVRDRIGTTRRALSYYVPAGLLGSFRRAAAQHGYHGFAAVLYYSVRKLLDYFLGLIAYFAPYNGVRVLCHRLRGVKIGQRVLIGFHCVLDESFPSFITIEDDVSLAGKNYLLTHSNPYAYYEGRVRSYVAPIVIRKHAWLTINVTVLPGVTIGEGSIITAGSVVDKNVPAQVVAGGVPAKVIKRFQDGVVGEEPE